MIMTKELLKSYKKLKDDAKALEYELRMMNTSEYGLGSSVIFNYKNGFKKPETVVGFDYERYNRKNSILSGKKQTIKFIEDWINLIEDDRTRVVFSEYYINDKTWKNVAVGLGYGGNEDYPRLHIHDKYLKEQGIK